MSGRSAAYCCFEHGARDFYCLNMKAGVSWDGRERDAIGTLCGQVSYVAFVSGSCSKRESVPTECHITSLLQRLQKSQQSFVLVPRFDAFAVFHFTKGQGSGFHFQIDFGIDVGRVQ